MTKFGIWISALTLVMNNLCFSQNFSTQYSYILKKHVNENGLIDYEGIQRDKGFPELIDYIAAVDTGSFTRNERLAFLINSYNILVIKNVLDQWPITSPFDVDGFFKEYTFLVAGERLSLDDLEYKKIFAIDDVLVHFGLVCAAMSCPPLIDEPFHPDSVYRQLEINGRRFLRDKTRNHLDRATRILYLSEIFSWFRPNFEQKYGTLQRAAMQFLSAPDSLFIAENTVSIVFNKYDWSLNIRNK